MTASEIWNTEWYMACESIMGNMSPPNGCDGCQFYVAVDDYTDPDNIQIIVSDGEFPRWIPLSATEDYAWQRIVDTASRKIYALGDWYWNDNEDTSAWWDAVAPIFNFADQAQEEE